MIRHDQLIMVLIHNMALEILVNISSGNGLLFDCTKPLTKPMLTYHPSPSKIYLNTQDINAQVVFENCTLEITDTCPRSQWVNQDDQ